MSETIYKAVDGDGYSRKGKAGQTFWRKGLTVRPKGEYSGIPCGGGCLHFYASPTEAVLYAPLHCVRVEKIYACNPTLPVETDGLKLWTPGPVKVGAMTSIPQISVEERVAWAICVAPHPSTREWAMDWLSGKDRTAQAARMAAEAARATRVARATRAAMAAEEEAQAREAARAARAAAEAWAARKHSPECFHTYSLSAWKRAQAILKGEYPADMYDAPH